MSKKLTKTDSVDIFDIGDKNVLFVESDYGNYVAIQRTGWTLELYDGSLNDYLNEHEISRKPRRLGLRDVGTYFGTTVKIVEQKTSKSND